jgi:rSAM/selenodomain-associated transferase 2
MNTPLSIIIPALNEERTLPGLLKMLKNSSDCEIILVDGGSTDATLLLAEEAHCITISSAQGRGIQMNLGAQAASGKNVLFLHADTRLPENFLQRIQDSLQQPHIIAGAFSLKIAGHSKRLAIIAWFANLRSRYLHLPYGDQAIFIQRDTFLKNGGFPEIEIMEDFVFMRNLNKIGTIVTLKESVTTSARRWQHNGILRTTSINQIIVFGFFLGVQPAKLASFYRRIRGLQKTTTNTTDSR